MKKTIKAWAIWHKHKDYIVDVAFADCGDFIPKKEMFINQEGNANWMGKQYKLIPCTITYSLPVNPTKK